MMKVAMIARSTLFTVTGGDTVQIMQTAKHLTALGVQVDIKLTNESIAYDQYRLLHFFNIIRPADISCHIKKSKKPFVVSTILVDYSEYEKYYRTGIGRIIFRLLSADSIEYLKTVARWLSGKDTLMSYSYLWKGQTRSIRKIIKQTAMLLPNSVSEYERLRLRYHCNKQYIPIPNGVDPDLFRFDGSIPKDPLLVICVARIEGLKNQLALIKALNGTRYTLLIIGSPAPNQLSYYRDCRKAAAGNVFFIDAVDQGALLQYYQKAKVHALPSWFETTGLSSLEAAVMGCNIVITAKGDTQEYFGDNAFYCEPDSIASIYNAVENASREPYNETFRQIILNRYTWQQAAEQTMRSYQKIIQAI